ncbi:Cd(II)/Pb(II)-responsive transcriptional regulator [Methylibium sp.]|uniref:Cd(II)/Pb(II)-responsive transcriptional regulator n=1 Tax=Methylibium sp. TaxID=2067992 RepID=UPI003D11DBF1
MKIGELAKAAQTQVETIRYYEHEGLLPQAPRTDGNYRIYGPGHVERLAFIRRCRSLDMTLDEIRVLLRFKDAPREDCGEVNALLDEHIGHVAQRVRELKALEKHLRELRAQCQSARVGEACGILRQLSHDLPDPGAPRRQRPTAHAHVGTVHDRPSARVRRA